MDDKINPLQGAGTLQTMSSASRSYSAKLHDLGWTLVATLHMLVRNVKLYGPENAIFVKPLEKLCECINTIIAVDGKLNMQCAGTSFYINDTLLRIDTRYIESVRYLHEEFERCDVGGITVDLSLNVQELRNFIAVFSTSSQDPAAEQGTLAGKLKDLKLRKFNKVKEILEHQQETAPADAKLDRKRYALVVYARMVHFMLAYLDWLRNLGPQIPVAKSRLLVQDLVDVCHGHRSHFLGLTTAEVDEDSLAYHLVNVTVLSIIFGLELDLTKERLLELGTAALFHDIGKVDIHPLLLIKTSQWTEEETREMARVPLFTVRRLLSTGYLDMANMHTMVAAYDHQTVYGKPLKDAKGKIVMVEPEADLPVYARIIAICDSYESLVHHWGYEPEDALLLMSTEWAQRYDPIYLRIFMKILTGLAGRLLSKDGAQVSVL